MQPAQYPLVRTETRVFHIPSGVSSYTQDNLFGNQLPKRITLGLVNNVAYNGDITKNPFNFEDFKLNKLVLYSDGERTPWSELKVNYKTNHFLQGYFTLFAGGDGVYADTGNALSREDYLDGNALYCFDLTPDQSASNAGHVNPEKRGNLRIDIGFATPLAQVVNVVALCEFDGVISIDKARNVTTDFAG